MTKRLAGQIKHEAQLQGAGDPSGQTANDVQIPGAARDEFAGQQADDAQFVGAGNGADGGHLGDEAQTDPAAVRATIGEVIEVGRQNAFAIRQRMRIRQATLSYIARAYFGYHTGLTEAERKKAMNAASALIKAVRDGEDHAAAELIGATDAASEPWEKIERNTERALTKLARKLPGYAWAKSVRGFGDLSFARIIAETGDLSGYDNPAKVWKRLGLAVVDGKSQRRSRDADKAKEQGYNPRRRAVAFVAFEPVLKAQSAAKDSGGHESNEAHDRDAAGADGAGQFQGDSQRTIAGPYRLLYDAKKTEYLARGEAGEDGWFAKDKKGQPLKSESGEHVPAKIHAHRAAMRYASKRLFRDMWQAWIRDAGQKHLDAHRGAAGDGDRDGHHEHEVRRRRAVPVAASPAA